MYTFTSLTQFARDMRTRESKTLLGVKEALVAFLALVADPHGFSFFREEQICEILNVGKQELHAARSHLQATKIIIFVPRSSLAPFGYYRLRKY